MTTTDLRPERLRPSKPGAKPRKTTTGRRTWLLTFAGFFLTATAWALALPVEGNTDEIAHVERAYAVATGQWLGHQSHAIYNRPGAMFTVPESLVPWNGECMFHPSVDASCQRWTGAAKPVTANSWTGRYSPLYYLPVGLPMRWWPNETGVIAGRVVSAAMNAALLATAATLAAALAGSRLLLLAVLAAATPSALNLAGAVNPNGLEISAGILFWTCVVVLLSRPDQPDQADQPDQLDKTDHADQTEALNRQTRHAATWAAIAGFILLTTRTLGPVWCAATLALAAVLTNREHLRSLRSIGGWRPRLAVLTIGAIGGLAWNLASGNFEYYKVSTVDADRGHHFIGATLLENITAVFNVRIDEWLRGTIAVAGQYDYFAPAWLVLLWSSVIAVLVGLAMLTAPRRSRLVVTAIGVTTLLLTTALDLKYVQVLGWTQVSRYFMPFVAGMWIVAASSVPRGAIPAEAEQRFLRTSFVVMAVCHLSWLALAMNRFQNGPFAPLDPFAGAWTPSVGTVAPLTALAAGIGCMLWMSTTTVQCPR
ncbi:hypothetical protein ABH935_005833 [Catenulispora sp. GAS73]|uniref:DUF2142 domain-containing protein n=1 Tax=Catenulispora sp. GAS73 TaxID=3156269 RepID=UPI0035194F55